MREKVAVAVLWHGAELILEKREEEDGVRYAFPGGRVNPGEKSLDATVREEFSRKPKVVSTETHLGVFREARLPYGTPLKPEKDGSIVFWTHDQLIDGLEGETLMPLSAGYVERHLQ